MKRLWLPLVAVSLLFASTVLAQNSPDFSYVVSLHQLGHKPTRQVRQLTRKGASELNRGDFQAAIEHFHSALELDPDHWDAQNYLGYAYLRVNKQEQAAKAFQRAIEIDPANAVGYINRGVSALACKDYKLAEQSARTALKLAPKFPRAKVLLGVIQVEQGHWTSEAHQLFEDTRGTMPQVDHLLLHWPTADSQTSKVVVQFSAVR